MRVVNPYTFVPFAPDVDRKPYDSRFGTSPEDLKSGYLDVEIITRTQTIIPDSAEGIAIPGSEYEKYPFFRIDGRPVIPGSELRGMLRSAYEAATNSCLPFLPNKKSFSLRTPPYGSYKCRGLLEYSQGAWKLYEAIVYRKKVGGKAAVIRGEWLGHTNAEEVSFFPSGRNSFELANANAPGSEKGILQFNIPVASMKNGQPVEYSVAVLQPSKVIYTWKDGKPYEALRESLEACNPTRPTHDLAIRLEGIRKSGGMIPVWYLRIERSGQELYYVSGSSIGRIHQHRSWKEIMGLHSPCDSSDALCPACALFGTVSDGGRKGRVRIGDAVPAGEVKTSFHILQPLAGPRHTAYEFYLEKPEPDANYWNYDYHSVRAMNPETGKAETVYRDSATAGPRGRKFYWHQDRIAPDDAAQGKMNSTMEAVEPGSRFVFRITFDRISAEQLEQLIWVINFGENNEQSKLMHKLGHAKPLGYGSVKLVIREGKIRRLFLNDHRSVSSELQKIETLDVHPFNEQQEPVRSLLAVADARRTEGKQVEYPRREGRKGQDIFTWFAKNRVASGPAVLPRPTDKDITLEADNHPRTGTAPQGSLPAQAQNDPYGLCGKTIEAVIFQINAEKRSVKLNLPGMARGFLLDRNGQIAANHSNGDRITVKVGEYDEIHGNYRTTLR